MFHWSGSFHTRQCCPLVSNASAPGFLLVDSEWKTSLEREKSILEPVQASSLSSDYWSRIARNNVSLLALHRNQSASQFETSNQHHEKISLERINTFRRTNLSSYSSSKKLCSNLARYRFTSFIGILRYNRTGHCLYNIRSKKIR